MVVGTLPVKVLQVLRPQSAGGCIHGCRIMTQSGEADRNGELMKVMNLWAEHRPNPPPNGPEAYWFMDGPQWHRSNVTVAARNSHTRHSQGFRYNRRWKSRRRGHSKLDPEIRELIRRMCRANPLKRGPFELAGFTRTTGN